MIDRSSFFPPHLPRSVAAKDLVPPGHLLARYRCTRYWHYERRADVAGLPPPGIPWWLAQFDWLVGWAHGWGDPSRFPHSVFCHPDMADRLLTVLLRLSDSVDRGPTAAKRIFVLGGEDTLLTNANAAAIAALRAFFDEIYFEAKNAAQPDVSIMPIGLTEFYLRGVDQDILKIIDEGRERSNLLLSSFGFFWPQLNAQIDDLMKAIRFARSVDYVTAGPFDRVDYFEKLASHRFMICPLGHGIQAPKLSEALILGCIPIMTKNLASIELARKGLLILLVDQWTEISLEILEDIYQSVE